MKHLLEAFIQIRYFDKYSEKLTGHITGENRVTFKKMFDEFTEGFYKTTYGIILSGAAHGVAFKDMFRMERESSTKGRVVLGCEYNEDHATLVVNYVVPLLFGFINLFGKIFPNNTISGDKPFSDKIDQYKEWLISSMEGHKKVNTRSQEWYKEFDKLIFW